MRLATRLIALVVVAWWPAAALVVHAQAPPMSLQDVAWLTGHWAGRTAQGRHIEEVWMPAHGGHMLGVFRWERGLGQWLFELLTLDEAETVGGVVGPFTSDRWSRSALRLRIKHFDRQLQGMEERNASTTLQLVEATADRLTFEMKDGARIVRVGYVRTGPDSLRATFDETEPGKSAVHIEFPYERVR